MFRLMEIAVKPCLGIGSIAVSFMLSRLFDRFRWFSDTTDEEAALGHP